MVLASFGALDRRLAAYQAELSGKAVTARLERVGVASRADIDDAVRAELGDQSMSGWRRSVAIPIVATSLVVSDHEVAMQPERRAAGPMRVLEDGRNQGNAGGFAGPGVNRATGVTARTKSGAVRKVRSRASRRWNGTTDPKHTWADAVGPLAVEMPKRYVREFERDWIRIARGW